MPLIRTYMHNSGNIAFKRAADVCVKKCLWLGLICITGKIAFGRVTDVCVKQCLWLGLICITLEKSPLEGLLMCACTIASSSRMMVRTGLNHTRLFWTEVSRICQWLLNNDYPVGGNRKERSHEINYPSLGLHAILDMRDKSLAGWTHSCILDKGGGNRTK